MKIKLLSLIILIGIIFSVRVKAQVIIDSKARIEKVEFFIINNDMRINYEMSGVKHNEKFNINLKIVSDSGKIIPVNNLKGDIGKDLSWSFWKSTRGEGLFKQCFKHDFKNSIVWEMSKDIDSLNDVIHVEIEATHINPKIHYPTGKAKAMLLSTIFPGWGSSLTRLNNDHLYRGALAYGLISGSLYFKHLSNTSYSNFRNSNVLDERNTLFSRAVKDNRNSAILLCSAGVLWLLDYANILTSSNLSFKTGFKSDITNSSAINGSTFNYPGISLLYNF